MDELLGFVVLTGPLLPILIWLTVSILLVTYIVKPAGNIFRRWIIKLLIFFMVFLLPFLDEIAGQVYFKYLCETQGGFKVYQTVELPDEYWDENGEPRFIKFTRFKNIPALDKVNGTLDLGVLPEFGVDRETESYSSLFGIRILRYWYYEKKTAKVLAENLSFDYKGGWLINAFTTGGASSCKRNDQPNNKQQVLSIFIPRK